MYVYHQSGCTPGLLNLLSSYLLCLRLCTPLITGVVFKNISRGCLWHVIYYFHFVPIVWFHVTEIGIHIGIYLMLLMLQLYNCTRIYIVKCRQSIAFGIIYICGVFLGSCEGGRPQKTKRKSHKLLLFVVLNIMLCSLDINISAVCTTALGKRQE